MKEIVILMCCVALVAGCGGTAKKSVAAKSGVPEGVVATVGEDSIGQVERAASRHDVAHHEYH